MADYFSLLNTTIAKLANNTADNRAIVYGKARAAIDKKLRAMQPAPSEEAIARQMELLENAIGEVEQQHLVAEGDAEEDVYSALAAHLAEPTAPPEPEVEKPPVAKTSPAPQTAADIPVKGPVEGQAEGPAKGGQTAEKVQEPPQGNDADHETPKHETPRVPEFQPQFADDKGTTAPSGRADEQPPFQDEPNFIEPASQDKLDEGQLDDAPQSVDPLLGLPPIDREPPTVDGDDYGLDEPQLDAPDAGARPLAGNQASGPKKSIWGRLIASVLGIGIIAGGGYAIWLNKDSLMDAVNSGIEQVSGDDGNGAQSSSTAQNDAEKAGAASDKDNKRLNDEGETIDAAPIENAEGAATGDPAIVNPLPDGEATGQAAGAAQGNVVADRAYLYTEVTGTQDVDLANSNVVWSEKEVQPGDGGAAEPAIHAQMDVPKNGMTMTLEITRNTDPSLSASHLIKINFKLPADFDGVSVDALSRFVMKSSEQDRGQELVAVPAKITDNYFVIALDNLDKAKELNKKLLLENGWIDIPLAYSTGVRGLITLEKGNTGEKVFKDVFEAWDKLDNESSG